MPDPRTFRAVIQSGDGGGAYVVVPFDVERAYGRKRVRVLATIDGEPYRGTLARMGTPDHILIILKEIRARIGKGPGDEVVITVEEDTEPRVVQVPADLQAALDANPQAAANFQALAYSHRREYVLWIEGAKREETRRRRIEKAVAMLEEGKKVR